MTNEELAIKAKAGNQESIEDLWQNTRSFIAQQAIRFYNSFSVTCQRVGVEVEDLIQAGYFALLDAINYYDELSEYTFLTFLGRPLKHRFAESIGWQNYKCACMAKANKTAGDSTKYACETELFGPSLDQPVTGQSSGVDISSLSAFMPDSRQEDCFRSIENADYESRLKTDLDLALSQLPNLQRRCIRAHYYENVTFDRIARAQDRSASHIRTQIKQGLKRMRESQYLQNYRKELISSMAYSHRLSSLGAWRSSGESIQEKVLLKLEREQELLQRYL